MLETRNYITYLFFAEVEVFDCAVLDKIKNINRNTYISLLFALAQCVFFQL